jgi:hypothetical protein
MSELRDWVNLVFKPLRVRSGSNPRIGRSIMAKDKGPVTAVRKTPVAQLPIIGQPGPL